MSDVNLFIFTCIKDGRKFLPKLLSSLLEQTDKSFKHFIYEDGSKDPSDDIVYEYIKKAQYEVIYEKNDENVGLNLATKHCIEKVDLPYFIWINCDDWVDNNFVYEIRKYIKKHPQFPIYETKLILHQDNVIFSRPDTIFDKINFYKKRKLYLFLNNKMNFNYFVCNLSEYLKINPNIYFDSNPNLFNDYQVCLPFVLLNSKFGYIHKAVAHYWDRLGSESNVIEKVGNPSLFLKEINQERCFEIVECLNEVYNKKVQFYSLIFNKDYWRALTFVREIPKSYKKIHLNHCMIKLDGHYIITWKLFCIFKFLMFALKKH